MKHEGTFKSHLRAAMNEEKNLDGSQLWWGERPRNRWVFVIAQRCQWAEGMERANK